MISRRKWRRAIGGVLAGTLASAGLFVAFAPAAGASIIDPIAAEKDCPPAVPPAFYTIGSVVPCSAIFTNPGPTDATVDGLTEQAPFIALGDPGNGPFTSISCTTAGNVTISPGSTLPPNTPCTATFDVTIPNDPVLCNTFFKDRVEIDLEYPGTGPPPLTAEAGATATVAVVCPPSITVTKTADTLSKVGDSVHYNIQVCNNGLIAVNESSVTDTLIGDISADFAATLAPGACTSHGEDRTVVAGDPDPLTNTVTATYTGGPGPMTATASASATTDLFQPGVSVTKTCQPDPIQVGQAEVCTIAVTNTSSSDAPNLVNGTITDTLNGNLLDPANTAVTSSTCTATLPTGASCQITTSRTVLASDTSPLSNTVMVHYNPDGGFANDITDSATASVVIQAPRPVGACHETVNPAGQPGNNTSNGFPNDPFGGHAVPGGKDTAPGTKGNGPINSDGFYLVGGNLFSDTTPIPFPGGGFVWPDNTTVKYIQRPGNPTISITAMAGPHSVIQYRIQAPGDLYAGEAKGNPDAVFCGVPPPRF